MTQRPIPFTASEHRSPPRFVFRDAAGTTVAAGHVQGAGGLLGAGLLASSFTAEEIAANALARLRLALRRLERREDPGIYSPRSGHLLVDEKPLDVRNLTAEVVTR